MARYVMAIDSGRCMNCKACIVACQQRNRVPYGLSRNWVRETADAASPCGWQFQPGACMHCDDPSCVRVCLTGATWKAADGRVRIDAARCIGCGACIEACPYHARFRHPDAGVADKCDYCRVPDEGGTPACVAVCPMRCRVFGDADDPASEVARVLAARRHVHVAPKGSGARPVLTYLDRTTPAELPAGGVTSEPVAAVRPLAGAVQAVGGAVLAALAGTWLRQAVRSSTEEERELAGRAAEHGQKREDA